MATELKRLTFAVTPEIEALLDEAKKMFYDSTKSEMIRTLVVAGLDTIRAEKKVSSDSCTTNS